MPTPVTFKEHSKRILIMRGQTQIGVIAYRGTHSRGGIVAQPGWKYYLDSGAHGDTCLTWRDAAEQCKRKLGES